MAANLGRVLKLNFNPGNCNTCPTEVLKFDNINEYNTWLKKGIEAKYKPFLTISEKQEPELYNQIDNQLEGYDEQKSGWFKHIVYELRTGKVKQVEKKVKLEKVKEHSMRAGSAISQIEQEIDDIKNNK